MDQENEKARGSWSHAVNTYVDPGGAIASLTASPNPGSRPVSSIRIRVDGETVAVARSDDDPRTSGGGLPQGLSVEAFIPAG